MLSAALPRRKEGREIQEVDTARSNCIKVKVKFWADIDIQVLPSSGSLRDAAENCPVFECFADQVWELKRPVDEGITTHHGVADQTILQ